MTNRSAGQTKTKDPRHYRVGKEWKGKWESTARYLRRAAKVEIRRELQFGTRKPRF